MKNLEISLLVLFAVITIPIISVYATHLDTLPDDTIPNGSTEIINDTHDLSSIIVEGTLIIGSNATVQMIGVLISGFSGFIGNVTVDGFLAVDGQTNNDDGDIFVQCGILDGINAPLFGEDIIYLECNKSRTLTTVGGIEFEIDENNIIHIEDLTLEDGQQFYLQENLFMNITGTVILNDRLDVRGNITNYGEIILNPPTGSMLVFANVHNVCENIDGRGFTNNGGGFAVGGGGSLTGTNCTPPVVSLVGETPDIEAVSGTYNELGATCFSDDEGQINGKVVIGGDAVDTNNIGIYDVDYDCEDSNVNPVPATTVQRMVAVVDTTMPLLVLNGDAVVFLEAGVDTYLEQDAMCFDLLDGEIDVVISGDTVNDGTIGTYVVDYDCEDANSNSASTLQRTVNVADTIPPVITVSKEQPIMIIEGSVFDPLEFVSCNDLNEGDLTNSMVITGTVNTLSRTVQTVDYSCADSESNQTDITVSYAVNKVSTFSSGSSTLSVPTTPFGQKEIPKLSDIPTLSVTDSPSQQTSTEGQSISDLFSNLFGERLDVSTGETILDDFRDRVDQIIEPVQEVQEQITQTSESISSVTESISSVSDTVSERVSPIADFFSDFFGRFFN